MKKSMREKIKKTIAISLIVCFLVSMTAMSASACSCRLTSNTLQGEPTLLKVCQGKAVLKIGNQGPAVILLQRALVISGYLSKYKIDGKFGSETQKAVKKFQADYHLATDGIVGSCTIAALDKDAKSHEWSTPYR